MKSSITTKIMAAVLFICSVSLFEKPAISSAELLGGPIKVSGSFSGRASWTDARQFGKDNTTGVFFITLEAQLAKNIKAYLGGYLFRRLRLNGQSVEITPFEIDKFISTANIEIRNVGGKPIAFIIGKQRVPFGSKIRKMPSFVNDPTYFPVNCNAGVFGFTVKLEELPFFDLLEASVFESQSGDLEIGTIDGASLRLTKEFGRRLKARASYMKKDHSDNELRDAEEKMRGLEAKVYVENWIEGHDGKIIIQTSLDERGKFGRILGRILCPDDECDCLNDDMIKYGYAEPYFGGAR